MIAATWFLEYGPRWDSDPEADPGSDPLHIRGTAARHRSSVEERPGWMNDSDVFINCPFSADYAEKFNAIVFTVIRSGLLPG